MKLYMFRTVLLSKEFIHCTLSNGTCHTGISFLSLISNGKTCLWETTSSQRGWCRRWLDN